MSVDSELPATTTLESSETAGNEESHDEVHSFVVILLPFIFTAIMIGVFFKFILNQIHEKYRPPYTAILFLFGFVIATINKFGSLSGTTFGQSVSLMGSIDHNVLLLVLLPPLLFESASKIDFHVFKRVAAQSLLLAFPGVILSASLTAAFIKGAFAYYNWTWPQAFVLGCILSATDPVSVVAALQSLGAPERISVLIEGESLLNDGSAFVMFLIFIKFVEGITSTPAEVAANVFQLVLGGPAVGLMCGIILYLFHKRIHNDYLMEIASVLTGVFVTYYLAEEVFKVSAVLAVVTLGLFFSVKGKAIVGVESFHQYSVVISQVGFLANTVIFVIAGAVVCELLWTGEFSSEDGFTPAALTAQSYGDAFALYLALHVIRAISIGVLWPILVKLGYGFNWKIYLLLIYSGLRGAVSLILALIVVTDELIDRDVRNLITFHVCAIVVLTTFLNGTTTEFFYGLLRVEKDNPRRAKLAENVLYHIYTGKIRGAMESLKTNWFFAGADWKVVDRIVPNLADISIMKGRIHFKHFEEESVEMEEIVTHVNSKHLNVDQHDDKRLTESPTEEIEHVLPESSQVGKHHAHFAEEGLVEVVDFEKASHISRIQRQSSSDQSLNVEGILVNDRVPSRSPSRRETAFMTDDETEEQVRSTFLYAAIANYHKQAIHSYIDPGVEQILHTAAEVGIESGLSSCRDSKKYPTALPPSEKLLHVWHSLHKHLPSMDTTKFCFNKRLEDFMVYKNLDKSISTLSAFIHTNNEVLKHFGEGVLWAEARQLSILRKEVNHINMLALETLKELCTEYPLHTASIKTINASKFLLRLQSEAVGHKHHRGYLPDHVNEQVQKLVQGRLIKLEDTNPTFLFNQTVIAEGKGHMHHIGSKSIDEQTEEFCSLYKEFEIPHNGKVKKKGRI